MSHWSAGVRNRRTGAPYALTFLLAGSLALVISPRALAAELTMNLWHLAITESAAACIVLLGCWVTKGAAGFGLGFTMGPNRKDGC